VTPDRILIFCTSPRTGSSALCSALWQTDLAGRPDEYLGPLTRARYEASWGTSDDAGYFSRVLEFGTTSNAVFSVKVHAEHLPRVTPWRGLEPFSAVAGAAVQFFWLRRRDRVRQAVSLYRAQLSHRYRRQGAEAPAGDPTPFDYARIDACLKQSERDARRWRRVFAALRVTPVQLHYEDHVERDYATTVVGILRSLGIEIGPDTIKTEYRKQADEASEELVQRFRRERRDRLG
jgi:LPS sulfotransferase NodH